LKGVLFFTNTNINWKKMIKQDGIFYNEILSFFLIFSTMKFTVKEALTVVKYATSVPIIHCVKKL